MPTSSGRGNTGNPVALYGNVLGGTRPPRSWPARCVDILTGRIDLRSAPQGRGPWNARPAHVPLFINSPAVPTEKSIRVESDIQMNALLAAAMADRVETSSCHRGPVCGHARRTGKPDLILSKRRDDRWQRSLSPSPQKQAGRALQRQSPGLSISPHSDSSLTSGDIVSIISTQEHRVLIVDAVPRLAQDDLGRQPRGAGC